MLEASLHRLCYTLDEQVIRWLNPFCLVHPKDEQGTLLVTKLHVVGAICSC